MDKIREMRQQRAALIAEARGLVDRADAEKRDMTAEENEQWDRYMADVDKLEAKIKREEKLYEKEQDLEESADPNARNIIDPNLGGLDGAGTDNGDPLASAVYRRAFFNRLRGVRMPADEITALTKGTEAGTGGGGYLVPVDYERTLIQALEDENVMRRRATVITTAAEKKIPVVTQHGTAAWIDETAAFTESEETFDQISIDAHKAGTLIKVSNELLQDSMFDLESYLRDEFARRLGAIEENAYIDGDGTKKPTGFLVDAPVKVTTDTDEVTADEVIDLYYSLRRVYRNKAIWMVSDSFAKAVRKLKDANEQYLWQAGLQSGQPDMLLGRPIEVADGMPEFAAEAKPAAFGDFKYYWIANRKGIVFQPLKELYATSGMTGFLAWMRVDGKLTLPEAIVVMQIGEADAGGL